MCTFYENMLKCVRKEMKQIIGKYGGDAEGNIRMDMYKMKSLGKQEEWLLEKLRSNNGKREDRRV